VTVSITFESYRRKLRLQLDSTAPRPYSPDPEAEMVASRARVLSVLEWIAAIICIIGVMAIGSVLVRDLRTVSAVTPVIAHEEPIPDPPAAVPARSVAVPMLLLSDGSALRVGDTVTDLSKRLGADAEVAPRAIDRTAAGERETRFFARGGQRFAVVLEPLAGDGEARVGAIYVPSSR
jgi:hypothetical protein